MWRVAPGLVALCLAASAALAQEPHIGYVYPAGAPVGAEIEVDVGGQYLRGVHRVLISGEGVEARVIDYVNPLTLKQRARARRRRAAERRRRIEEQQQQGTPRSPESASSITLFADEDLDLDAIAEARRRQADARKQPNPQIAEIVRLYVTVASDAALGARELRLETPAGVSNPVSFHIGDWQEVREVEPNDRAANGRIRQWLPVVINGQIMPGDVDRFRFRAHEGTRLVVAVSARRLIPYLADAVPGWFQATLTLFDARGHRLAYVDDFRFDPDPVIGFEVPRTGEYELQIRDAIYRGREDFVYRIAIGSVPFVTGIFPLGGRVGARTTVTLAGWNLPGDALTLHPQRRVPGIVAVEQCQGARLVQPVPFALDTLPECLEAEPNDEPDAAQVLRVPRTVNGRIDRPGDWDVFRLQGRAGQRLVAEVHARRLGSPLDSLLKLTDADGTLIAANDDHVDKAAGLATHHADSYLNVALPADGTYLLHVGDTQHKGGSPYAYRLRVGPPRPDFAMRVVPCSLNAAPGSIVPITAYALRKDGFDGPIALRLVDAPTGFELAGARIPAGREQVRLTLQIPRRARRDPLRLRMEGVATIDGHEVRRPAVPAEDRMQAFIYRHLVPAEAWLVSLSGSARRPPPVRLNTPQPVALHAGGTTRLAFSVGRGTPPGQLVLELNEPPEGIVAERTAPRSQEVGLVLRVDAEKIKPGRHGNLLVEAFREYQPTGKDGKPSGPRRRTALGLLPAMRFEVVPAAATRPAKR